jgi:hypothetical protein
MKPTHYRPELFVRLPRTPRMVRMRGVVAELFLLRTMDAPYRHYPNGSPAALPSSHPMRSTEAHRKRVEARAARIPAEAPPPLARPPGGLHGAPAPPATGPSAAR